MQTVRIRRRFVSLCLVLALLVPLFPAQAFDADADMLAQQTMDTIPPSAVTTLVAVPGALAGTVQLHWIAPGDDATTGTATTYIVRYSAAPITEETWASATNVSGAPAPGPAGSVQSMTVAGLSPGQTYYFAVKTQDAAPNTSGISNSARARAQTWPNALYLPLVTSSTSPAPVVIPETTKVLTETVTQYLSEISGDGAVFTFTQSTPALQALTPGEVIVGDVSAVAPTGFLRKVTAVSTEDGQVIVETDEATLEEAIQDGAISFSKRLTPADLQSMTALPGVTLASMTHAAFEDSFYFKLEDVVLYDRDGNLDTTHDQLKVDGSLELAPDFDFALEIKNWTLQELEFIFNLEETVELEFNIEVDLVQAELFYEIAHLHLGIITVMVGPVPVVFVIEMPIYVRGDGTVSAGITASAVQQASLSAGLRYLDGAWAPVASLNNSFNFEPPRLSAGAEFKGYIDPPLSLLLYGVAGPFAGVTPYLKLEADVFATPWWELHAGLETTVGVKIEVLGRSLGDHTTVVIGYEILLAQAQTNTPAAPIPAHGATGRSLNTTLGWSGGDRDDDAVTYDVYFEADSPWPTAQAAAGQSDLTYNPGLLNPNTEYFWRIVARDAHGATTPGPVWRFRTGEDDSCDITLTLQPPQVTDLTAVVSGTVASACSTITRLNWQWGDDGASNDQWFPASHTYAISGTYPITVTAHNDLGDAETAYTTAYVGVVALGEMVLVPAGEFQMGCHPEHNGEYGCNSGELPLHTVYLDTYYIDKYEVTNALYAQCVAAGACAAPASNFSDTRVSYYDNPVYADYPVIHVSWYDARDYCAWADKRLPTEAEWEKVARGPTVRTYPWGNQEQDCMLANSGYWTGSSWELCVGDTTQVGSYPAGASPYGALDMAGNVWEWVNDWYSSSYYSTSPYANPPGPAIGTYKVVRGGGFGSLWGHVRVALRNYGSLDGYPYIGFRCASDAPGR